MNNLLDIYIVCYTFCNTYNYSFNLESSKKKRAFSSKRGVGNPHLKSKFLALKTGLKDV
jgi:hypothetical protein